nr:MAG TPA: capsid protein [Caudoviricetes sp.]
MECRFPIQPRRIWRFPDIPPECGCPGPCTIRTEAWNSLFLHRRQNTSKYPVCPAAAWERKKYR